MNASLLFWMERLKLNFRHFFWYFVCRITDSPYLCKRKSKMVDVAQSVRASDCGSEGRRFEPDLPPFKRVSKKYLAPSIYSYPYWRLKSNIRFYKGVFCLFGHPLFSLSGLRNSEQRVEKVNDHTIQGWMRCTPDGKESVVSMPGK